MNCKYPLSIVLTFALTGSNYFGYSQTKDHGSKNEQVIKKQSTRVKKEKDSIKVIHADTKNSDTELNAAHKNGKETPNKKLTKDEIEKLSKDNFEAELYEQTSRDPY